MTGKNESTTSKAAKPQRSRVSCSKELKKQAKEERLGVLTVCYRDADYVHVFETQEIVNPEQWRWVKWSLALALCEEIGTLTDREQAARDLMKKDKDAIQHHSA